MITHHSTSIIGCSDCSESLLTSGIPTDNNDSDCKDYMSDYNMSDYNYTCTRRSWLPALNIDLA